MDKNIRKGKKKTTTSLKEKGILESWKGDVDALLVGAVFFLVIILLTIFANRGC